MHRLITSPGRAHAGTETKLARQEATVWEPVHPGTGARQAARVRHRMSVKPVASVRAAAVRLHVTASACLASTALPGQLPTTRWRAVVRRSTAAGETVARRPSPLATTQSAQLAPMHRTTATPSTALGNDRARRAGTASAAFGRSARLVPTEAARACHLHSSASRVWLDSTVPLQDPRRPSVAGRALQACTVRRAR